VLFLDEFDALGRTRTDSTEHNELRRVVNSLLTMMDRHRSRGLFVAATNLPGSLDEAVWRRFDEVITLKAPDKTAISELLALKFKNFPTSFRLANKVKELGEMSYADIERICFDAIKSAVIARRKTVSAKDFSLALKREQRRQATRG
jgi:AAA+ superfamily predicted ATPase